MNLLNKIIEYSISIMRLGSIKIITPKRIQFTIKSFVSYKTEIDSSKHSKLVLGHNIRVKAGSRLKLRENATIVLDQNTSLNNNCLIVSHERIVIGQNVMIGPNVMMFDHDHDYKSHLENMRSKYLTKPIIVGDNVWIGAGTIILKGTTIGNNSIIGAGCVLKGDYPDNSIIIQERVTLIKSCVEK